ncbi:MAG: fimbrillin family protein [Bacteroides sp.]|nr:fimbrillin family protein [Bacteroides sp.]
MKIGLKLLAGMMLSPLFLQSCQQEEQLLTGDESRREIVFTSIIDDSHLSRVVDASWEQGDEIGVFMKKAGTEEVIRGNVPYVTKSGNGNFVGENGPMEFPEGEGVKVDFIAYYPYTTRAENFKQYGIDLTNQQNQRALDLMKAVNLVNRDATSQQGNLQFRHLLSKLILNLTPSQGASLEGIKATVSALKVKGNANLAADGTITLEDQTAAVEMFVNEEGTQAEAVLLPQDLTDKLKITLELNGQQREVTTNISGKLEAGKKYICNLKINFSGGGQITPEPQAKYARWGETPLITDADLANKNLKYITHYSGEKYTNCAWAGTEIRNYSMLYDTNLKMAYWVAYPLCHWYLDGNAGRTNAWGFDTSFDSSLQPKMEKGLNGYDRGHQIPSGDRQRKSNDKLMNRQTFFFTNMTAQVGKKMNQSIWQELESAVRDWSSATDTLYVVTGAMPTTPTDKSINYTKDNSGNNIAVPKYYFKALARKSGGNVQTVAYKLENRNYPDRNYEVGRMSVNELEELTGFNFFCELPGVTEEIENQKSAW